MRSARNESRERPRKRRLDRQHTRLLLQACSVLLSYVRADDPEAARSTALLSPPSLKRIQSMGPDRQLAHHFRRFHARHVQGL